MFTLRTRSDGSGCLVWMALCQKVRVSTYGALTAAEIDSLADRFLQDFKCGKAGLWSNKSLSEQTISPTDHLKLFPILEVFEYVQDYDMKYVGISPADSASAYRGFDVIRYQSDAVEDEAQYFAEVYFAEKTVSEWYDYLDETFAFDMQVRKFFQYGSDSGAFDYAIGLVSNHYLAGALSLGTLAISLLLGDAPPQMRYILEQLEGHAGDEKVTIVFYEKVWKKESNLWTEIFNLNEYSQIHSKKHY